MFTTYIYYDPKSNVPRYVGEGTSERPYVHLKKSSNRRLNNLIKKRRLEGFKMQPRVIEAASKADAQEMEMLLIEMLGREDLHTGTLFNLTAGGEGVKARTWKPSPEEKARISAACSLASKTWWDAQPGKEPKLKPERTESELEQFKDNRRAGLLRYYSDPAAREAHAQRCREIARRPEVSLKKSAALKGMKWWNNGERSVRSAECPGEDWQHGRIGGWKWRTE
jgi:hypothetical protein